MAKGVNKGNGMRHVTIYLPDGGGLPYLDNEERTKEGVTATELLGALAAASMQTEISLQLQIESAMIKQMEASGLINKPE